MSVLYNMSMNKLTVQLEMLWTFFSPHFSDVAACCKTELQKSTNPTFHST